LEDGSGKIVDAAGGELATLKGHEAPIMAASWTRCGTRLATASSDTTVRVWDATSGREIKLLAAHRGPVCAVAYSPDETLLATASWDRTVKVWQVKLGKLIPPAIEGVASFRTATIGWIDDSKLLHTNKDGSTQRLDL
jgi:WD40 repeat protein